jgi:hypothetical protein
MMDSDMEARQLAPGKKWGPRTWGLRNLLKMGHCAPTVMKTILDAGGAVEDWPVRMAGGLPGGIGDTGYECGGITSPLIYLGLRGGLGDKREGLPLLFYQGLDHLRRFLDRNGTPYCRDIRGDNYRLTRCIRAVCCAPEMAASAAALTRDSADVIPAERRAAYGLMYSYLEDQGFHCARQVLIGLGPFVPPIGEALDAVSGFVGGTLFQGMTCGAYAAGVMAIGLKTCEIEDSLPRVMRMIVLMKTGGAPFADHINKFNRTMNLGKELGRWFAGECGGSTQCRELTGCDFSSAADVERYIQTDGLARCRLRAEKVTAKVRDLG